MTSALQKGDLILITGGTGWVGSHIVEKAIEQGFKVRLAIRDEQKAKRMIDALKDKYGESVHLETVQVSDFTKQGAYDEAVKDVQGIIHSASTVDFFGSWEKVVLTSIKASENLLKAANSQAGSKIRKVVITSSNLALGLSNVLTEQHWTNTTWNKQSMKDEKRKDELNPVEVYAAAKTLSEKYAWAFMEKENPKFDLIAILPGACFGGKVVGTEYMGTGTFVRNVCMEKDQFISQNVLSQYFVNVDDVALVHVLALLQKDIQNERILAFNEVFSWDDVIDLGQKVLPTNKKFNPSIKSQFTSLRDHTKADLQRVKDILQPFGGLKNLEQTVRENLED